MEKIILLAIDGLSWNIIEELKAKKQLKNIEEITNN